MAAGLGFKDFQTGEVLLASDVDGYLMQGIWVFASAAARDAAVTSPQEGNFAYLKDTNVTTYYTGSAWANLDTTGMTNPMTTTGDTIYSSSGSTPARLGIGTAGQVLQVNSGATAPEWATPASGSTFSGCKLYKSAAQTINNATTTVLTWDSETFDVGAYHSTVTNTSRITIPSGKSGYFQISANARWAINSAGAREFGIQDKNGTKIIVVTQPSIADEYIGQSVSTIIYADATDYFEVIVYQSRGGTLDIRGGSIVESSFGITYLGA
jgi:hypothetical protein